MPRTLAQNAQYINETIKPAIKSAIEAQGVTVPSTDSFLDYADRIAEIETGGGGGTTPLDTSKVDYQSGNFILSNGRYLQGFKDMQGHCVFPMDDSNTWLDVDWSDSFEIGVAFKYTNTDADQTLFGSGVNGNYYKSPIILLHPNTQIFEIDISTTGNSWNMSMTQNVTYSALTIDTWYFLKMTFSKSDMNLVVEITDDSETWTTLLSITMSATYFHDTSSICFGGFAQNASLASNGLVIDTFNTYIKDSTGSIVWGCSEGAGAEYGLYNYIESDGTQVIDMGFAPKNGDIITVDGMLLSAQTASSFVWGATDDSAWIGVVQESSQKTIYSNSTSGSSFPSYIKNQLNTDTITANRDYTNHLCMFGFYISGNYVHSITTRIYSVQVNDNFYLPAKRKSDGAFGLWDVANQTFLTDSAGGNAFVGGNPTGVEV